MTWVSIISFEFLYQHYQFHIIIFILLMSEVEVQKELNNSPLQTFS